MKPCTRCHRHVRRTESGCPFCGAALHDAPAPPALAAWSLGALLVACGPGQPQGSAESTDTSTSTSTSTGTPDNSTGDPTTTTTTSAPTPTSTSTSSGPCGCEEVCDAGDEAAGFIYGSPGPDLGIDIDCDIYAQDCCPDRKCAPWSHDGTNELNGTRCIPITGDQQPGEPCTRADPPDAPPTGIDDCRPGALCWDVDEMQQGTCVELCSDDEPPCSPGFACIGSSLTPLCLPSCDPMAQDCPVDETCIPASDGFSFGCIIDVSGDGGQANDPCEFVNSCDPGLMCLNASSASSACDQDASGCCQPFCEFPDAPCPNPDQTCVQWFAPDDTPPGQEDLGICIIPA